MVHGFWILLDCGGLTQPPPFRSTRFDMKNKKKILAESVPMDY